MKLYVLQDVDDKTYLSQSRMIPVFVSDISKARRFGRADALRAQAFYSRCQIVPISEISAVSEMMKITGGK